MTADGDRVPAHRKPAGSSQQHVSDVAFGPVAVCALRGSRIARHGLGR